MKVKLEDDGEDNSELNITVRQSRQSGLTEPPQFVY